MNNVKIFNVTVKDTTIVEFIHCELDENGLFILGGKNGNGKTSFVNAVRWALGGNKYKPSNPQRKGTEKYPDIEINLTENGKVILKVECKGKNSALKVTDPSGMKGGQKLLDSFIGQLALDLPKFMNASDKEKAKILLDVLGVGKELHIINTEEFNLTEERKGLKKETAKLEAIFKSMEFYKDVPEEETTIDSLMEKQDKIIIKNEENRKKKESFNSYEKGIEREVTKNNKLVDDMDGLDYQIKKLQKEKLDLNNERLDREGKIIEMISFADIQRVKINKLKDAPLDGIKQEMKEMQEINFKVRENQSYLETKAEAEASKGEVSELTEKIEGVRTAKKKLLDGAKLPLEGLSIIDGELVYNGDKWDCMASSDQLKVSTCIVRELYPKCGFVLMDKLHNFDREHLLTFGKWLVEQDLQVIGTMVDRNDECSIIIQDGKVEE